MVSKLSVMGLGKLGSPLAACFGASGFQVTAVDVDPQRVDAINRSLPPVHEPSLAELILEAKGRLRATQDAEAAVRDSEATFIVVSTPSEPNGGFSLRYVLPLCEAIGRALRSKTEFHLVVLTSTVMPGSTGGEVLAALEGTSGKRCGQDFGLCYSPEFIALGTVIRDFYYPDFLLIGESDSRAGEILSDIYRRTCKNSPRIARMNFINAEITKIAVNTYITTKISYANMLARLCEKLPGADAGVVTEAIGLDSRIGSKYLKGAVSYGGPCFPRDNRAMAFLASSVGAFSDLAETTDRFNCAQIKSLADLVRKHYAGKGSIGILGLTYKPNTDVIEESFGLLLAQELTSSGVPVIAYDPSINPDNPPLQCKSLRLASSAGECISAAGIVVLATPWQQFLQLPLGLWLAQGSPRTVIDCWRVLGELDSVEGLHYIRLGQGATPQKMSTPSPGIR
jgi:UDPglucose 6-dehydrogenase